MKYVLYNIKSLIKKENIIFVVIMLCIIASAFVLNFSYGLYKNFQTAKIVETEDLDSFSQAINKNHAPTHFQVRQFVESLSDETLNQVTFYFSGNIDVLTEYGGAYLESRFIYRNGEYAVSPIYRPNAEEQLKGGRMITDEEERNGDMVACIESEWKQEKSEQLMLDDETILFMGREYRVIGETTAASNMIIPFLALPDDFVYDDVVILNFDKSINRRMYDEIIMSSETYMPGALTFPELKLPDTDTIAIFDNLIVIAILISVFSAVNFVLLYHFILSKRTHDLAIFRICGCNKIQCFGIYIGECLMISIPCYIAGSGVFLFTLHSVLQKIYPYILEAYSLKVYGFIFAVYIVTLLIVVGVMIAFHVNKSVVTQIKERRI